MYTVYIKAPREDTTNAILIYDDLDMNEDVRLIDPKLTKEDNAAGSYEFEVPLCNRGYDEITPYTKDMDVFIYKLGYSNIYGEDGTDDVYWAGRVVDVNVGIDNHKVVYCEGVLGFLNDSTQTPGKYETKTSDNAAMDTDSSKFSLRSYLYLLLDERHNAQVADNRKIYLGLVTITADPTVWYTNFESTMDVINSIAETTGGHIRIRRSVRHGDSVWVLDLLNDQIWSSSMPANTKWRYRWVQNTDQKIIFGDNMTDLNKSMTLSNIVTGLFVTGKRKDTSAIEGIDEYIDLNNASSRMIPSAFQYFVTLEEMELPVQGTNTDDFTHTSTYKYLRSSYADDVGLILSVVNYDDVEKESDLVALGCLALTPPDAISYEVEAGAVDASYRNRSLQPIDTYDVIQVYAKPHGLNEWMKVTKSEIPLDHPIDTVFTIGASSVGTFTSLSNKNYKSLSSGIRYLNAKPYFPPPEPTPGESEG